MLKFNTLACALLIAALSALTTNVVYADPWGTGGSDTGTHPDLGPETWCYGPSWPSGNESAGNAIWNLANQTYAGTSYKATCDLTDTSQTDVKWGSGNLDGTTRGVTKCAVVAPSGHCDRNNITMDFAEINQGSYDGADQWKTACHELGHAVGLTHGPDYDDCMMSGAIPSTATRWHQYADHHVNHINNWFQ